MITTKDDTRHSITVLFLLLSTLCLETAEIIFYTFPSLFLYEVISVINDTSLLCVTFDLFLYT